jgi:release factor glutamine methyltransferase
MRYGWLKRLMMPKPSIEEPLIEAGAILADIAARLPDNGQDDRRRDARHLLALAIGRKAAVMPHETITITAACHRRLDGLVARRIKGEPISRIRGWRQFYGLDFALDASTLDPRPDSEVLVDTTLDWLNHHYAPRANRPAAPCADRPATMLDLGTGSGCLLLALVKNFSEMSGIGVDLQPAAIAMAQRNAETLGLAHRAEFRESDWDGALKKGRLFDVIISNPPYIPTPDLGGLMDEVRLYDPLKSLDGGSDGLAAWRCLAPVISRRLRNNGAACVEIGQGQDTDVTAIFAAEGMNLMETRLDLSGVLRCLRFAKTTLS